MSACVLPIGPDFQDPLASTNYYPIIEDSSPPEGQIVFGTQSAPSIFKVTVSDPNIVDDLHVRWMADFPPFDDSSRVLADDQMFPRSQDGSQLHETATIEVTCLKLATSLQVHQIMAIVADRPFDDSSANQPDKLADPLGFTRRASWYLNLVCQ